MSFVGKKLEISHKFNFNRKTVLLSGTIPESRKKYGLTFLVSVCVNANVSEIKEKPGHGPMAARLRSVSG